LRILVLCICVISFLQAGVYYSKLEPIELYKIKANASGGVVYANKQMEGKLSDDKIFIKIDDALNKEDLKSSLEKLNFLQNSKESLEKNLKNSKKIMHIREENYNRIKNLKTKSKFEKDNEFINLLNTKNQVLSLTQSLENLNIQIADLRYKIKSLKDTIKKKNIYIKNRYIYKLYVKEGDFVGIGSPLVDVYDISKGKLTIFLSKEDLKGIENKSIFIDDKLSNKKFSKIWKVADSENISSYQAEIIVDAPKQFSKLVKIEVK